MTWLDLIFHGAALHRAIGQKSCFGTGMPQERADPLIVGVYESLIQASRWFWIWWPITHAPMP